MCSSSSYGSSGEEFDRYTPGFPRVCKLGSWPDGWCLSHVRSGGGGRSDEKTEGNPLTHFVRILQRLWMWHISRNEDEDGGGASGRAGCGVTFHGFTLSNGRVQIGGWMDGVVVRDFHPLLVGWMGLCGTWMRAACRIRIVFVLLDLFLGACVISFRGAGRSSQALPVVMGSMGFDGRIQGWVVELGSLCVVGEAGRRKSMDSPLSTSHSGATRVAELLLLHRIRTYSSMFRHSRVPRRRTLDGRAHGVYIRNRPNRLRWNIDDDSHARHR
ncbi:hypothetical protein QBC39DRAFT_184090 [Podospora conica]|nr:hypothetical protein QBC39DRAFT_184090 [Schizothecium conicum]